MLAAVNRGQAKQFIWSRSRPRFANKRSELESHPRAGIGDAGIVAPEIGVRDVVDDCRDAVDGGDLIAELDALAEQHRRAEFLAAKRCTVLVLKIGRPQVRPK